MDIFGGIFDDIRSVGDDVSGFFKTSLGQAVGKAGKALLTNEENKNKPSFRENFVDVGSNRFDATDTRAERSNNFSETEIAWYKRLERFRSMVNATEVKK